MKAVVIGAGVGGLACAIQLAHAGHDVVVLERAPAPGGKCARITRGEFVFDAGPSLLTMPHVFARLFADTGTQLADELELLRVEPVTRYRFADGSAVELSADLPRAVSALEAWSPGAGEDWISFMSTCGAMWAASRAFLTGPALWPPRRPAPGQPPPDPRDGLRVRPWWTLGQLARAHARDPRLQMIIERFATYAGADPRRCPAALALAGYVEHVYGAWYPRGGMYELVLALARRLQALGGELRLGCPAHGIAVRSGRARAVVTDAGAVDADVVVADVDEAVVRGQLLAVTDVPARRRPARERSLSGLTLLLGLRGRSAHQAHHSIQFPADYQAEFDDVFVHRRPVREPTIYVSAPVATDPRAGPADAEAWLVLVNAPAVGDGGDWEAAQAAIIERLGVGERVVELVRRSPGDLERETGAFRGAIYGAAPHGRLGALRRPGNRVAGVDGLWLVGGTVHPGGGLPVVTLGARAVADQIGSG